jgi:hypothetical protein
MPPAGESDDHPLPVTAVAHRASDCRNPATECRPRHRASLPDRRNQVSIADDPVAIADEELQQIKDLRFDADELVSAPQFAPIGVKRIIAEEVDQPCTSRAAVQVNNTTKSAESKR